MPPPFPTGNTESAGFPLVISNVTGEAFHCNDWVSSEEGPRPVQFHRLAIEGGNLAILASDTSGQMWKFLHSLTDGSIRSESLADVKRPANNTPEPTACPGRDGTRWSIEKVLGEPIVVQIDPNGEVLRRLSIGAGDPAPVAIAASLETRRSFPSRTRQ